jgi:hypothetical protein
LNTSIIQKNLVGIKLSIRKETKYNKKAFLKSDDSEMCWLFWTIIVLFSALGCLANILENPVLVLVGYLIFFAIISSLFLLIAWFYSQFFCPVCQKRKHPLFYRHVCTIRNSLQVDYDDIIEKEINDIKNTGLKSYFQNNKEKRIFISNITLLIEFERLENFKYCMIAMGSILELLLIRYCKNNNLPPEDYKAPNGSIFKVGKNPKFVHYVETAIKKNIFGMKKRWELVQNYLRDFRNYVHIEKEAKSDEIDKEWYETMKPVFDALYEKFKENPI